MSMKCDDKSVRIKLEMKDGKCRNEKQDASNTQQGQQQKTLRNFSICSETSGRDLVVSRLTAAEPFPMHPFVSCVSIAPNSLIVFILYMHVGKSI